VKDIWGRLLLMNMQIEKYEKIGKDKYRLYLDNGEVIDTYDEVILKYELLIKHEIDSITYSNIFNDTRIYEAYLACLKYIAIRIRSTKEIIDYLKKKNIEEEDSLVVVERLKKEQALDDDYFCQCFIKDKLRFTTMGNWRIINELKFNQIDQDIIDKYSTLMSDEVILEKIEKLVDKQIRGNHKLDSFKLRNKIYHHLLNLGYSSSLIVQVLNSRF